MNRNFARGLFCTFLVVAIATGCKPKASPESAYFKTPFQSESQFIVYAIVSDLAEQIYYVAK